MTHTKEKEMRIKLNNFLKHQKEILIQADKETEKELEELLKKVGVKHTN
jgi:hypothetical protein